MPVQHVTATKCGESGLGVDSGRNATRRQNHRQTKFFIIIVIYRHRRLSRYRRSIRQSKYLDRI